LIARPLKGRSNIDCPPMEQAEPPVG
jgi:hypothetical protein